MLDPARTTAFRDHYLEVELDLSDVLFIATANVLESIPGPLLDRMELITLDGYTEDEKVIIARDHLLPRQLDRAGLETGDVDLTDAALHQLAAEYTREAGVRSLERTIGKVLRKIMANGDRGRPRLPVTVDEADLHGYLGHPGTPESTATRSTTTSPRGLAVTRRLVTCCSSRPRWPTRRTGCDPKSA